VVCRFWCGLKWGYTEIMPDSHLPAFSIDTQAVREEVSKVYSRVASDPDGDFHFHCGPAYAAEFLGYDPAELAALPSECVASFAGIANPHAIAPILSGETVLDIGCGAGTDLLLAARKVGPKGRAIGIDMTEAMRDRALASAAAAGLANVEVHRADATALPLPDASVNVVISNGVLNLVPEKDKAFAEIWRVLRSGGRLQLGDIVLDAPLSAEVQGDVGLWTD
jgi:arsenite methyltransferase